jgi:F0F1-type ATP synthase membrane subunit b/b'
MDETRHVAEAQRAELLAAARTQAETSRTQAAQQLAAETAEARTRIEGEADALASTIVERVLGRRTT